MEIIEAVQSFISEPQPARFESLALAVFRYQVHHVPVYRRWISSLGINPVNVDSLEKIPPASTAAFKYASIDNELLAQSPRARIFLTSGTTVGNDGRGRHVVPRPEIYHASAVCHLRRMMFPDGARLAMLAMHPTADRMPQSSLAQMISWCIDEFGNGHNLCTATPSAIDVDAAIEFIDAITRTATPVCILGTTASCAVLFETMRQRRLALVLPAGSRLMDTGGAKGQRIPLSAEQVAAEAHALLGMEPALVINEYGMTEMCSQLYDSTSFNSDSHFTRGQRIKIAPPWLKPTALDPVTLTPVKDGEQGLLGFFDLANVGSISALMTEDIGIVHGNGVVVLGRAGAAEIRGCALAIEEFAKVENSLPTSSNGAEDAALKIGQAAKQQRPGSRHTNDEPASEPRKFLPAAARLGNQAAATATGQIKESAAGLRNAIAASLAVGAERAQAVFDEVVKSIAQTSHVHADDWGEVIRNLAHQMGCSETLLELSLATLVRPLNLAGALMPTLRPRRELLGLIAPGNIPGAGLHELVLALLSGSAVIVKTSIAEPLFFHQFAVTLRRLDAQFGTDFGARVQVINWGRERTDLTETLMNLCDRIVAFGDDETIAALQRRAPRSIGFDARVSGVAVTARAAHDALKATAKSIALDCSLFDQRGCLSPHHVFVEGRAHEFASELAAAFRQLDLLFGNGAPHAFALEDAVGVRRVRSIVRWRAICDAGVELWEGPNFHWTVVFDSDARFTRSPGRRTVFVSPFHDVADLESRLEPVKGRLEAFALAEPGFSTAGAEHSKSLHPHPLAMMLRRLGATYICPPGEMQSPPLDWPHGGGDFVNLMVKVAQDSAGVSR